MSEELVGLETIIRAFLADLAAQSGYSKNTRAAYASDLRIFVDHLFLILKRPPALEDLDGNRIADFFESEQKAGRQLSTLQRRRAAIQRFVNYLIGEGLLNERKIDRSSLSADNLLEIASSKKPPVCLTDESVSRLLAALDKSKRPLNRRDRAILSLLLEAGLSVSTLISINLYDLDLGVGKIHLKNSCGEDCWLPLGAAAQPIKDYVREARPELNPPPDEPALFISQNGVRMSRQSIWQILKHWGKTAGLDMVLSPRIVRHTAALRLTRAGRSASEIQILLGHRNPLSTQALLNRLEAIPAFFFTRPQAD
jgi:integrase/recombinase XerD